MAPKHARTADPRHDVGDGSVVNLCVMAPSNVSIEDLV